MWILCPTWTSDSCDPLVPRFSFMTLSQESNSQSVFSCLLKNCTDGSLSDDSMLTECQQSAEQGSAIAQLILAQLYWARQANPTDKLLAYKWCLIASAEISRTSKNFSATMTMEQLLYAEKMAADWLRKIQKIAPTSIARVSGHRPSMGLSAVSG